MSPDDVIDYFGSGVEVARFLGIKSQNVYVWRRKGYVPIHWQVQLSVHTNGKLEIEADLPPHQQIREENG
jgi:hypothetical protein